MSEDSPQSTSAPVKAGVLRRGLAVAGSLWFAAVLLMLGAVAMGAATVVESARGTEYARAVMYGSWWFRGLLALVGVNVLASMLVRFPFRRSQVGFVLTHAGILTVLTAAWLTDRFQVDGRVAIPVGQAAGAFQVDEPTLALVDRADGSRTTLDLDPQRFRGFEPLDAPRSPVLQKGDLQIWIRRYLPDSRSGQRVVNDNPHPAPAVEVSWAGPDGAARDWLFAERPIALGPHEALYRFTAEPAELNRWVQTTAAGPSMGTLRIQVNDAEYSLTVEECREQDAPVADTGYRVRVLRYLPHATVGEGNEVTNASERPVNPAVEVELTTGDTTQTRICFAKFPDFPTMHGQAEAPPVKVTFVSTAAEAPAVPVEILGGPDSMFARFLADDGQAIVRVVPLDQPVDAPWPGETLTVHRRFDHARLDAQVVAVEPVRRQGRVPAVELNLATSRHKADMWVQYGSPRPVSVDGRPYQVEFDSRLMPLGFSIRLDKFDIGLHPGTDMPRSFESTVTLTDPASGEGRRRVISMNQPASHRGYTFYQSSYQRGAGSLISVLGVGRDPGLPVAFTGYGVTTLGMLVVLCTRLRQRVCSRAEGREDA